MFDAPNPDEPFEPPEPSAERWLRQALAYPGFREATCELIEASANELGLARPCGRAGVNRILADEMFRRRFEALTLAVLEAGA